MDEPRRLHLGGCVLAIVLLAGCTPGVASPPSTPGPTTATTSSASAPSASATPSPSPTVTWNATQATAIKVVEDYFAAGERLFADPTRYSKAEARSVLEPLTGRDMLEGNLVLFQKLKSEGKHYEGGARLAWISASNVFGSGAGESVNVTVCRDPQGQTLVDKTGKVLSKVPAAVREFEVLDQSGWRIVSEKEGFGAPCSF
jgi:hypothetical protein